MKDSDSKDRSDTWLVDGKLAKGDKSMGYQRYTIGDYAFYFRLTRVKTTTTELY